MGRPKTDVRISLKGRDGKTIRVGLVKALHGGWHVYRNGKMSAKIPHASSTRIGQLVALWLRSQ